MTTNTTPTTAKRDEFDFGFSFAGEDELRSYEKELEKQLEVTTQETSELEKQLEATAQNATLTAEAYKAKLNGLRDMVMPLLRNLQKEPDKNYIWWPERQKKVQEFINKVNTYVDGP